MKNNINTQDKENILVSACLVGVNCRYDGSGFVLDKLDRLQEKYNLIPVCPEVIAGLPIPRVPAELTGDRVTTKAGNDFTKEYHYGANEALKIALLSNCKIAILKEKSPSCGSCYIYDGTFSGKVIAGEGITAKLLKANDIKVFSDTSYTELL